VFIFAHLSDPHLGPVPVPRPWQLFNKRLTSYFAWLLRNRWHHDPALLAAIVADLRTFAPEHIAITGDVTNISLPQEFIRARLWLEGLGAPTKVTVVPGNHDACVPIAWRNSLAHWDAFMSGSASAGEPESPVAGPDGFPFVRRRGPVAFIGLNSAVPRPIFGTPAAGALGAAQIARLKTALERLGKEGLFRVVLLHHAPHIGLSPRKALLDACEFAAALAEAGAELILHGHLHQSGFEETAGPVGSVPVLGIPSASAHAYRDRPAARFHIYQVAGAPGAWQLDVLVREALPRAAGFHTERSFRLNLRQGGLHPQHALPQAAEVTKAGRDTAIVSAPLAGQRR
jgi:3',5'-cyclic AMP phosphodiesterase CpdA